MFLCSVVSVAKHIHFFLLQNVHSEARRRDCSLCGKVLWSKRAHAIHYRMKHSAASKVGFRCRICQKRFDSKDERCNKYNFFYSVP
jgi:RNase P subunit RPR2